MGGLIAIDPGNTTGWAEFDYNGVLVQAGARSKREFLLSLPAGFQEMIIVIELPVIYPHGGKGDPNDLITLAVLVGEIKGHYYEDGFYEVELVKPRTWKGTVPKGIHNQRTLEALTAEEQALLPRRPRAKDYDHNMLDAVGLGLWKLGRS